MIDGRQALPVGTQLTLEDGRCYCITGEPIGYGGGSILYPAAMQSGNGEEFAGNSIPYVIKECYPVSFGRKYHRQANGEIIPERDTEDERAYLHRVKEMQIREGILANDYRLHYETAGDDKMDPKWDNSWSENGCSRRKSCCEYGKRGWHKKHL